MKATYVWKYVGTYMSKKIYRRTYKTAFQPTGLDGIVVALDGYEAS